MLVSDISDDGCMSNILFCEEDDDVGLLPEFLLADVNANASLLHFCMSLLLDTELLLAGVMFSLALLSQLNISISEHEVAERGELFL